MKYLIIDLKKCIGCYNCQITCKDEHVGNEWLPYAKSQSEGQFWIRVEESERGSIPKLKIDWLPILCMHCDNAPCMKTCKVKGAIYRREDGLIIIDPIKCNGCRDCINVCPYRVIYFNDNLNIAQKCTMCAHLLDDGWKQPRCVSSCPTEAISYGECEDLQSISGQAEVLSLVDMPSPVEKAQVLYTGLRKRFIAGEIYCPKENKCLEGAQITLTDLSTNEKYTTKTNNYGDFWLEKLNIGIYHLTIDKAGYYPKEISSINTIQDVNLGSIKLFKKV